MVVAVEEQFYIIWPVVVALLARTRSPILWLVAAFLWVMAWRLSIPDIRHFYYRFDTRMTGLLLGAILYFGLARLRLKPWHAYTGGAVFLAVCLTGQFDQANRAIPIAEISSALLIGSAASGQLGRLAPLLRHVARVSVGRWSYAIYLWHFPIAITLRDNHGFAVTVAITLGLSVSLAALSYYTIEAWGRRLRDRDDPRGSILTELATNHVADEVDSLSSARLGRTHDLQRD